MPRRARVVGLLWRWHRRLGLAAAALVLLLAVTGIALNHTTGLGLDRRFVASPWLLAVYGADSAARTGYRLDTGWLSRSAAGGVYLDAREVAACRGELVGGALLDGVIYAGCAEELLLLTPAGELIETFTASTGLPTPLAALGVADGTLALSSAGSWVRTDLDLVSFDAAVPPGAAIVQTAAGALPDEIDRQIPRGAQWLTWERVLLDLHSGRLAGPAGVALVDALGLVLCVLGASGFLMWWLHRRRNSS